MAACCAPVGVMICLSETKSFLVPTYDRRAIAKQTDLSKKSIFEASYLLQIRVVGYPKMTKFRDDRLLCCRWCLYMFNGYKKAFFSPCMRDGKLGRSIKKKQPLKNHICSKIRVVVYPKMIKFRCIRLPCCCLYSDMFNCYD